MPFEPVESLQRMHESNARQHLAAAEYELRIAQALEKHKPRTRQNNFNRRVK